ncbi:6-phosphogluconolactonase [Halodesulfovibrio marinisediminis]|uniref:6-phosphogluconolactonase n=1 Tax=Halodesulfovibrio marinisediminis DSM 17456 TaxID=1121457 RepID=A0A1N6DIQ9_9BACT|nr:6-phosphogluconolactonase [Halodesulfovibrio marinisediminis]SIN70607.1 6-phosphogluconolactonase [Halodesulfovibrio marinisediminis DSM 17456]
MTKTIDLTLSVTESPQALARHAAKLFVDCCHDAIEKRGEYNVALSGGRTPKLFFETLASSKLAADIPWEKVNFYWVDERCVGPDDEHSNYRLAKEELLHKVAATHFYRMKGEINSQTAADEYESLLRRHFQLGAGEVPRFDFMLLGMGSDGHTASLFPGYDGIEIKNRLVTDQYIREMESWRITLTLPVLNNARACVFLIQGKEKHELLAKALNLLSDRTLPAQRVQPHDGKLYWIVDQDAYNG